MTLVDPSSTNTVDSDYIAFDDIDREALGNIAELARQFIHQAPTRANYDAWHQMVLDLAPMHLGTEPENGPPPFSWDYRRTFKIS